MMLEFEVTWEGRVREVYYVMAESEAEARENWTEGDLSHSVAFDGEVVEVAEVADSE